MIAYLSVTDSMHFSPILKVREPRFREVELRFNPRYSESEAWLLTTHPTLSPSAAPGEGDNVADTEEIPDLFSGSSLSD